MTSRSRSAPRPRGRRHPELDASGRLFEAGVLELLVARREDDVDLLMALAQTWAELGRPEQGVVVDQKLVDLRPEDPVCRYNLACSLSRLGRLDEACGTLLEALELGFRDTEHLLDDADLENLRADPRFGLVRDRVEALQAED